VYRRSRTLVVFLGCIACEGAQGAERERAAGADGKSPSRTSLGATPEAPAASSSTARAAVTAADVALAADAGTTGPLLLDTPVGPVPAARARRLLHVGDSMVPLVGNYLRPIVQARGGTYDIVSLDSTSTREWGGPKRILQDAMFRYDPEVILISLGSNELFDQAPQSRAESVRQIITDTRGRPCLWISPPAWKRDFGFLEMLRKNLGHCRYFDSTRLNLPRMPDGRHPDWTGGYRWASGVWKALGGTEEVPTGSGATVQ
jgi:hypothetical protein